MNADDKAARLELIKEIVEQRNAEKEFDELDFELNKPQ